MADTRKEQLETQFADAALLLLMDEYADAEGQQLWDAYRQSDTGMPEALDQKIQAGIQTVYKKTEKSALLRRTGIRAAKIAAGLAAALSLSVNLVLSVEALRVPLLNFYLDARSFATSVTFWGEDETAVPQTRNEDNSLAIPSPKGYDLQLQKHNYDDCTRLYEDSSMFLVFLNEAGDSIHLSTNPAKGSFSIDTEDCAQSEIILNGQTALYLKKRTDDSLRVLWVDTSRNRLYDLYASSMPEKDFIDYATMLSWTLLEEDLHAD